MASRRELQLENERLRRENFRMQEAIRAADTERYIERFDAERAALRQRYEEGAGEFAPRYR